MKISKILLAFLMLCMLTSCESKKTFLGYVEGRLIYVSSPFGGKLNLLSVQRGSQVKAGDALFLLDQQPESSDLNSAAQTVAQNAADLADKMKGDRPSELAAIEGQVQQAQAQVDYAQKDVERKKILVKKNALEQNQLDKAIEDLKVAQGTLTQYQENLVTAHLTARSDEIDAMQAQLAGAKAQQEKAQWSVQQKQVSAQVSATVFDTYYRVGETVPANQAVLSLLAPADIKVIFFVDEQHLSQIKLNQKITVNCDSCSKPIAATISFISSSAEFTPPVIYSPEMRAKLVYEVEARFDSHKVLSTMHPGQPLQIQLTALQR